MIEECLSRAFYGCANWNKKKSPIFRRNNDLRQVFSSSTSLNNFIARNIFNILLHRRHFRGKTFTGISSSTVTIERTLASRMFTLLLFALVKSTREAAIHPPKSMFVHATYEKETRLFEICRRGAGFAGTAGVSGIFTVPTNDFCMRPARLT